MQTLLGVNLPKFARYGWICLARRVPADMRRFEFVNQSPAAYLAVLLADSRRWEAR